MQSSSEPFQHWDARLLSIPHSQNAATNFSASIIAKAPGNHSAFGMSVLCHLLLAINKTKKILYYPSSNFLTLECLVLIRKRQKQFFLLLGWHFFHLHMLSSDSFWCQFLYLSQSFENAAESFFTRMPGFLFPNLPSSEKYNSSFFWHWVGSFCHLIFAKTKTKETQNKLAPGCLFIALLTLLCNLQ